MNATFGQLFKTPLATYDHTQSCWKMFGDTSALDSPTYSPTLPVSGSMRNGELFDRPMSAHLTDVRGSTSLQRLPTPTASEANGPGDHGTGGRNLRKVVDLLPTPTASDGAGGRHAKNLQWSGKTAYRPSGAKGSVSLREAMDLLPTPRAALADNRNSTPWIRPALQPQNLENAIAHVIGADTPKQSNNGKQSPGPHPLTLWTKAEE